MLKTRSRLAGYPGLQGEAGRSNRSRATTPTCHILEWFDLAAGILAERPRIKDGVVSPLDLPGAEIVWDEKAIDSYAA